VVDVVAAGSGPAGFVLPADGVTGAGGGTSWWCRWTGVQLPATAGSVEVVVVDPAGVAPDEVVAAPPEAPLVTGGQPFERPDAW
jgi:hypothetical protein